MKKKKEKPIGTFYGKDILEMSKSELLDMVRWQSKENTRLKTMLNKEKINK